MYTGPLAEQNPALKVEEIVFYGLECLYCMEDENLTYNSALELESTETYL
jgi:hypothetical protein